MQARRCISFGRNHSMLLRAVLASATGACCTAFAASPGLRPSWVRHAASAVARVRVRDSRRSAWTTMTARGGAQPSGLAGEGPLCSIGIMSDIQYADVDDGASFGGTPRYYRHALEAVKTALESWAARPEVCLAVHLGDILDGKQPRKTAPGALQRLQDCFARFNGRVLHVIGNHCLYSLERSEILQTLGMADLAPADEEGCLYYSMSPAPGVRLVVLDGYDISYAWPAGSARGDAARAMLSAARAHLAHKDGVDNVNSPALLDGYDKRWVAFNGAVGRRQLAWLEDVLAAARGGGERVIVVSHNPLVAEAAAPQCVLWNAEDVLAVIARFRDTVGVCLSGHAHAGGFTRDEQGVPHRVLEAIVECPPGTSAHGLLHVFSNRVEIEGSGGMASQVIYYADTLDSPSADLLPEIDQQRDTWRRPHGHGLAGGMGEEERARQQALERRRGAA